MRGENRCTRAVGHAVYRARYYNPYICRFINADPSGFAGGLNFYAFCNDNPISMEDPFGLWTWGQVGSGALHFGEGVVVGAAIAGAVVLAAPEIVAGGTAALVWSGVSAATATTVATGTVDAALLVGGGYGGYTTIVNTSQSAGAATVTGNWNDAAFNLGVLGGGGLVGVSGGGRAMAEGMMGEPSTSPNTWNPYAIFQNEVNKVYNPFQPDGSTSGWLASSPTPFSAGLSATGVAAATTSQSSSTGK
jgi:RHS repeat-associated protein